MLFSVIINNYNYRNFVEEAVRSVLAQDYPDFELIVVDDGSTDGSVDLLTKLSQQEGFKLITKANGGQASAFAVGFRESKGEWISFLDSDDIWDTNRLSELADIVALRKDFSLICHRFRCVDASGEVLGAGDSIKQDPMKGSLNCLKWLRFTKALPPCPPTSFFVLRQDVLTDYCETLHDHSSWRIDADAPLRVFALFSGVAHYSSDTLGSYRLHGGNAYSSSSRNVLPDFRATQLRLFYLYNFLAEKKGLRARVNPFFNSYALGSAYSFRSLPDSLFIIPALIWFRLRIAFGRFFIGDR